MSTKVDTFFWLRIHSPSNLNRLHILATLFMLDSPLWLASMNIPASTRGGFPFDLPLVSRGFNLDFSLPVTFFAGENGAGKSTILEVLALAADVTTMGEHDAQLDSTLENVRALSGSVRLSWRRRARHGFFFRAEDFFGFQKRLGELKRDLLSQIAAYESELSDNREANKGIERAIGYLRGQIHELDSRYGEDADARSHGEAFLNAFAARIAAPGLYLLDEPEAALSPVRQMAFLKLVKDAVEAGSQFVIATHSPLVLRLAGAQIVDFDQTPPTPCEWDELASVRLWSAFWSAPDSFLRRL